MVKITLAHKDSLIAFLRNEVAKRGFQKVVVGLSGGIDSAVVVALCQEAFSQKDNIHNQKAINNKNIHQESVQYNDTLKAILMPSLSSSEESIIDSLELCHTLHICYEILPITLLDKVFCENLAQRNREEMAISWLDSIQMQTKNKIKSCPQEIRMNCSTTTTISEEEYMLARGNFCARMRMATLYHISQIERRLVIGTSNKSEIMLGYSTLFGDMAYAINPIGNLYKTQIYELAKLLNIPETILKKAPSADLYNGQSDEQDLGYSYSEIDKFLEAYEYYVKSNQDIYNIESQKEYLEQYFPHEMVRKLSHRIYMNAFKQNPPTIFQGDF
ncbi:NAD(+) synthase [Helicobacter didelphidarum]|uniref:NH(3)-dependent NAD(+) synthetase n=1 Tax=Helicobacter didelphidarum TaxID=2040648 RepID=A0A3D8IKV3_9HELI|nr:NAD(+) synthase [Helicobacter didelphidarum]RDU65882.1 NAD(+) synthase [Helicobacter didelphidarum]